MPFTPIRISTPPKAYSYIRFSTPQQAKGDSHTRQTDKAARYAAEHEAVLDTAQSAFLVIPRNYSRAGFSKVTVNFAALIEMHHRTVFEAQAAHFVRCCPSTGFGAVVTKRNTALSDRPTERIVNLSRAFHRTAPSLVSSVGSVGLGSVGDAASGDGNAFGVTPSTSRRPSA